MCREDSRNWIRGPAQGGESLPLPGPCHWKSPHSKSLTARSNSLLPFRPLSRRSNGSSGGGGEGVVSVVTATTRKATFRTSSKK
mmetsp:Transcript_20008/g.41057  ORF Transcript_20008/g.41057 Transcript_20008/m.41057 type:complete len:84 (-) Transcript_20008:277-528(-)